MRRRRQDDGEDEGEVQQACWLCARALGEVTEWHHPVPKSKKGKIRVPVHPICHRTLHDAFTNNELARIGTDRDLLVGNERVAKFLVWIADKDPDFHAPTRKGR